MKRREFIALVGSAAASWPPLASAQQSTKHPIIGYISPNTASAQSQWTAAFVQRLRELGWIEGKTVAIKYRWADGNADRLHEFAAEFVREEVVAGGLLSYGPNFPDLYRRAAEIIDKILRGAKPADIPVEQPTKFDFTINLTTAKKLGLKIPASVLSLADELIE
jgi:ABC transporter substrate binding protein